MSFQDNTIEAALLSIQDTLSILHAPFGQLPIPPASLRLADRLVGETSAVGGGNLMRSVPRSDRLIMAVAISVSIALMLLGATLELVGF